MVILAIVNIYNIGKMQNRFYEHNKHRKILKINTGSPRSLEPSYIVTYYVNGSRLFGHTV